MPGSARRMWPAVLVVAVLGAACSGAAADRNEPVRPAARDRSETLDLATLPESTATAYRFIEAHQALAERLPCYCGCGKTLGHRSLRDCFITPQGGYDRHAAGCGVCQAEAKDAAVLLAQNMDPAAIRARIEQTYGLMGPPTDTR